MLLSKTIRPLGGFAMAFFCVVVNRGINSPELVEVISNAAFGWEVPMPTFCANTNTPKMSGKVVKMPLFITYNFRRNEDRIKKYNYVEGLRMGYKPKKNFPEKQWGMVAGASLQAIFFIVFPKKSSAGDLPKYSLKSREKWAGSL